MESESDSEQIFSPCKKSRQKVELQPELPKSESETDCENVEVPRSVIKRRSPIQKKPTQQQSDPESETDCEIFELPSRPRRSVTTRTNLFVSEEEYEEEQDPYADDECEYGSDPEYEPNVSDISNAEFDASGISNESSCRSPPEHNCFSDSDRVSENEQVNSTRNDDSLQRSLSDSALNQRSSKERVTREDDSLSDSVLLQSMETRETERHSSPPAPQNRPNEHPTGDGWETTTKPIPNYTFDESSVGFKKDLGSNVTELHFFECFLSPEICEYLVKCSNDYGVNLTNTNRPKTRNSRDGNFRLISLEEMKQFIGLCLLQGQISTTNMRRYFSYKDPLYYHPIFSYVMSSRRFEQILRVFCCAPLSSKGKNKVQPFIDMLITKFQEAYSPSKELSLDESLLHYRGRLNFRVYIKNKKARYGIKFFELTSSDGYVLNIEMYSGSTENNNDENSKTDALVLRLMRPYLMKGHDLFMDNYYNSYELSEKLLQYRTHTTGTLRANRKGNPKALVSKKLKKGDHFWVRMRQVYVSKWKDKRDVLVITTRNHPRLITTRNRYGKIKEKPEEVKDYNDHMSGIDRKDQMTACYACPRKTIRWYKKVAFYLIDLCVWNAFYLYRKYAKNNTRKYRLLEFRDKIIKSFLQISPELKGQDVVRHQKNTDNRKRTSQILPERDIFTFDNHGHFPEKIPGVPGPKSHKKSVFLKCRLCTTKKIRKETSYRCKGCTGRPPLCPDCFEEYHLMKK